MAVAEFPFYYQVRGFQYHAIPNYKFTFDRYRKPTPFKHIVYDFETFTNQKDTSHTKDYVQSAIEKHGWQREFHKKYPLTYPYIHFHVFDEVNTKALFEYIFENVKNDVIRTEEFGDNLVLCSNILKPTFVRLYSDLIERYRNEFDFSGQQK